MSQKFAAPSSPRAYASWHEDPKEQQIFLNLINTEGFILEDALDELLTTSKHDMTIHRGKIFEKAPHRENVRPEIDLWVQCDNFFSA